MQRRRQRCSGSTKSWRIRLVRTAWEHGGDSKEKKPGSGLAGQWVVCIAQPGEAPGPVLPGTWVWECSSCLQTQESSCPRVPRVMGEVPQGQSCGMFMQFPYPLGKLC